MAQKPETNFRQNTVIPFLKTLKWTVSFPIQQLAIRGTPDFLLCSRGRFIALELKDRVGVLSDLQEWNLNQVNLVGGLGLVADQNNWQKIKKIIIQIDKGEF